MPPSFSHTSSPSLYTLPTLLAFRPLSRYRAQLAVLRRAFDLRTEDERQRVDFQTIDAYQVWTFIPWQRAEECGLAGAAIATLTTRSTVPPPGTFLSYMISPPPSWLHDPPSPLVVTRPLLPPHACTGSRG